MVTGGCHYISKFINRSPYPKNGIQVHPTLYNIY